MRGGAPAPVIGRRVGGGFEIDSILASQREEALRIQARKEREAGIRAEQAQYNAAAAAAHGSDELGESTSQHGGSSPPLASSPRGASIHTTGGSGVSLVPPAALRTIRAALPTPQQKVVASVPQTIAAIQPQEALLQQKRRQTCQQMGFPTLWSYAQTRVACEELSRGIGELAFAHGGEKVFSSPAVLQTYKELQLSCLQDPLLAPMVTRIQKFHDRGSNKSSHQSSPARPTNESFSAAPMSHESNGDGATIEGEVVGEEDDRVGVERFALPPNELSEDMDPIQDPPLAVPVVDALETVLAFSTLSTAGERRAIKGSHLHRMHQKRSSALYSLLLPQSGTKAFQGIMEPTAELRIPRSSATEAVHFMFWYIYYSFFVPDKVEVFSWNVFPLLSEALMAIQLQAVTLRNYRLDESGAPISSDSIGVIEHTNNKSEPLDFLPFVFIHTVCFLFPVVFPASHDLFTVDFFNRASMLMNLILTGVDSDAQYWVAMRESMFSAAETRVEDIAVAAEVARMESNRMLQGYQDDVQQLRKMKDAFDKKQVDRTEAMLRAAEGKPVQGSGGAAAGSGASREAMLRRMERRSIANNVRVSTLYCPPLDTIELGDPVLHLLNDAVFDPEYAQDVMRNRQDIERFGRSAGKSEAMMFRPRTKEEASKFRDAIVNKKFYGHAEAMRAATCMEVQERYRPSVYPPSHIPDQSIMERNIATLRQQISDEANRLRSTSGFGVSGSGSSGFGADGGEDEDGALGGGFVVRFTPLGVRCSPQSEVLARSFRVISTFDSKRRVMENRQRTRAHSPLQRSTTRPRGTTALDMQLSMFNGPPNVVDAEALTQEYAEPINRRSPHRQHELPSVISSSGAEDPALEEQTHGRRKMLSPLHAAESGGGAVFGDMLRTPQFGHRVKSFVTVRSPSASTDSRDDDDTPPVVDEEASAAVDVIANVLFPKGTFRSFLAEELDTRSVANVMELEDIVSNAQAVGRRNKVTVMGAEELAEKQRDAPLALKSYISLKRHESIVFNKSTERRSHSPPTARETVDDSLAPQLSRTMMPPRQRGESMRASSLSALQVSHNSVSTIQNKNSMRRPTSTLPSTNFVPASTTVLPTSLTQNTRRSATPSSRPNGTLMTTVNASAMSPSSASIMHHQTVGESQAWRGMTYAVKRTQKYIDDAVRIHNAQCEIKEMVSGQFQRQRETDELRKRASDRTFDDEMTQLRTRITDPLQRTMLVNDWIEREPSRRLPDRDKHAALLRGTLLAEEAQHTGMMVREGLRKLEITFARRRKQSRMRKL
ncbi:Hypothetical protein, putative [Bodo saltans]|uniref:Uncharacterized protein n=1 Tax=Bodo saltans TaxID=75058 RepID=A0A0S4KR35_BODSA|nr:Hypothetical protein, putative [Bodo saltans]|eukprot:CUI15425.1 Hypothetical protein, putative [Bodo saltans]